VDRVWKIPVRANSTAGVVAAKFKNLRYDLKKWETGSSHLKLLISNYKYAILILDQLEEERTHSSPEFNFRNIVKVHKKNLLHKQSDYFRMRCTIIWFKLGGANTIFFMQRQLRGIGIILLHKLKMMKESFTVSIRKRQLLFSIVLRREWELLFQLQLLLIYPTC
jgi:hypothetical protein